MDPIGVGAHSRRIQQVKMAILEHQEALKEVGLTATRLSLHPAMRAKTLTSNTLFPASRCETLDAHFQLRLAVPGQEYLNQRRLLTAELSGQLTQSGNPVSRSCIRCVRLAGPEKMQWNRHPWGR